MKAITNEQLENVVTNLARYMDFITLETNSPAWTNILVQFDLFFRYVHTVITPEFDVGPLLKIMIAILKIPGINSVKVTENNMIPYD